MLTKQEKMSVNTLAARVLIDTGAKNRIKDGFTRIDPFEIAHSANVLVMLRPLEKLLGAFIREEQSGILVNSERPSGLIQMTCAHELGHFFMDHDSTADEKLDYSSTAQKKELEADCFAYNLVAPRWAIANILRIKGWSQEDLIHPFVLYQLALRLGISYQAAAWSLNRMGLINQENVNKLLRTQPSKIKKALLGSTPEQSKKDVWLLDETDQEFILEPRVDDQVIIRLKNHTHSGYIWNVDEASSEGFTITPLLNSASNAHSSDDCYIAGKAHQLDYLVTPKNTSGIASLSLSEQMAWDRSSPSIDQYTTQTCYENLTNGLSPVAKKAMLKG